MTGKESGVLVLAPLDEVTQALARSRWPFASFQPIAGGAGARIDLSQAPRGLPGFEDGEGLALLSLVRPGPQVVGWFCDATSGSEGVRILAEGQLQDEGRVEWARPPVPDPLAWPLGRIALQLRIPVEAITKVARPARPPIALAIEGLLHGQQVADPEVRHQALEVLGELPLAEATAALAQALASADWVDRYTAARAYARRPRQQGQDGRPALDALLADEDESVRQSALEGILELIPEVAFSDKQLQRQIDAAIARGLADPDEDVKAAAALARDRRRELLG